jgi:hypothetical protein
MSLLLLLVVLFLNQKQAHSDGLLLKKLTVAQQLRNPTPFPESEDSTAYFKVHYNSIILSDVYVT